MKTSIYIACHKPTRVISNDVIKPIKVGFAKDAINDIALRDDEGSSIAHKNASYCELTAHYWAWKHDIGSDYVGMMHYRRYFDFSRKANLSCDQWGVVNRERFGYFFSNEYGLGVEKINDCIASYDLILPHKWSVKSAGFGSISEHYEKAPGHYAKDLKIVRDIIAERHPDYLDFYDFYMASGEGYFTNMFVMRRALFDSYSEWLFAVLEEAERRIDITQYDPVARRVFGYLSERLFNVWLLKVQSDVPTTSILSLNRVFVHNTDPVNTVSNGVVLAKPDATVAIASSNEYSPHLGGLLASIVANVKHNSRLEFVILDGGISNENRFALMRIVGQYGLHSIRFIDMSREFVSHKVHMHFSQSTFYRLVLSELLPNRARVLYLDCDTIVLGDVVSLYSMDLKGNLVGAVFDYIMHHFCNTGVKSMPEAGGLPAREYLENYVEMGACWSTYFQAGVIIFDLDKLRELQIEREMIAELQEKTYWFLDQDVLNKFIKGRVAYIDPIWNVVNVESQITAGLSNKQISDLVRAKSAPCLIHYAGYEAKPWVNEHAPFAGFYWQYMRATPWYETVRESMLAKSRGCTNSGLPLKKDSCNSEADFISFAKRIENYHRMSKDPFISTYRKIRRSFGGWPYDPRGNDISERLYSYHAMTKDPLISAYRKTRRTFNAWPY